jgi:hypothetical protein
MTNEQKARTKTLVEALRDVERYPKNPEGWRFGRSDDGALWSFHSIITDVYHQTTGEGQWIFEGYPQYGIKAHWQLQFPKNEIRFIAAEYFGIVSLVLVAEWLADPSGHPSPRWGGIRELECANDTFEPLAVALENTYLKEIPTSVEGLTPQSTKGDKNAIRGRSPFERSALAFQ